MTASSRGYTAAASLIRSSRHPRICSECITTLTQRSIARRQYAVAASQITSETQAPPSSGPHVTQLPPVISTSKSTRAPSPYTTQSGILLSRPPLLTRPLYTFEQSYFLYQKRLNERLALPFTRYFYFKKDTPADNDWKLKAKARNGTASRDVGSYAAYSETGWNDEVLVGDKIAEREAVVESLLRDSVVRVNEDGSVRVLAEGEEDKEIERPSARATEADKKAELSRLDRRLDRSLYLVVKGEGDGGLWRFPSGDLVGRENLHQAAERILVQSAGMNMNTWIVGHVPIGHYVQQPRFKPTTQKTIQDDEPSAQSVELVKQGSKTFFMKARIMAGQADLKGNAFGWKEYQWLVKEEVKEAVGPQYWSQVKNMMVDR